MRFEIPVRPENRISSRAPSRFAFAFCAGAFATGVLATGCGGGGGGGTVVLPAIAPSPEEMPPAATDGGAPATSTSAPVSPASSTVKAAGDAKVGDTARCPVSGEEFVVTATSPHADYNGKTYYFCCGGCEKKFMSSPQKYTSEKTKS